MAARGDLWLVVEPENCRLPERRAINSHYIWVTGMLQLQHADKTLLCKRSDEGKFVMEGEAGASDSYRGRSVYSVRHMSGGGCVMI